MNDVETLVRDALRHRADRTVVRPAPAFARRATRRSPLPLIAAVAAAAAVAALVVGTVVLMDDDAPAPVAVQTPEQTVPAAPLPPRYVVDLPGAMVTHAETDLFRGDDGGERGWHVQSFVGADGYAGPQVHLLTVPPPDDGYVDDVDTTFEDGESITVQGTPARLLAHDQYVSIWWPNDIEPGVLLQSWALPREELLAVADGLARRVDGAGWDTSYVPVGLTPGADADRLDTGFEGGAAYSAGYRLASGSSYSMTAVDGVGSPAFDDLVANRIGQAEAIEAIEVAGRPAVLLHPRDDAAGYVLLWQPTDDSNAELFAMDVPLHELRTVLAALRLATEDEWVRDPGLPAIPEGAVRDR